MRLPISDPISNLLLFASLSLAEDDEIDSLASSFPEELLVEAITEAETNRIILLA